VAALNKKRPSKLYVLSWGPDSRHLHDSRVIDSIFSARLEYAHCLAKAKKLVRVEYEHRMSEGDKITVLSEQLA
jgi:hypothetical protein